MVRVQTEKQNSNQDSKQSTPERNIVILTVPHAQCPPIFWQYHHACDFLAQSAALSLTKKIQENPEINEKLKVVLFMPIITRIQCDLNRKRCRETDYRQDIAKYVSENLDNILIILDIHSYPSGSFGPGGESIILLDDFIFGKSSSETGRSLPQSIMEYEVYNRSLANFLNKNAIRTRILRGERNDIQDEMKEKFNLPATLIEYNESLRSNSLDEDKLDFINEKIAEWIMSFFILMNQDKSEKKK